LLQLADDFDLDELLLDACEDQRTTFL
jgi:hypothetical protein